MELRKETMNPRVINTPGHYEDALRELQRLMALGPGKGTADGDRLELFALLLENYEKEHFPIEAPSALEAIRFRMEEQDLSPKDLEPFIGSRSKVSEVLSGKIPLSLRMIRELNRGLGIPYEVLIGPSAEISGAFDWSKVPVAEMAKLGWINADKKAIRRDKQMIAKSFFEGRKESGLVDALLQRGAHARSTATAPEILAAWFVEATRRSMKQSCSHRFERAALTSDFLRKIAQKSIEPNGPVSVRSALLEVGVIVVVVPRLARTRLDGAAFLRGDGYAVIALTLRYDRIDSFWFTLLHELVHLARHSGTKAIFADDLDATSGKDPIEQEADIVAHESVVPRTAWARSDAHRLRTASAVVALAAANGVHPALVAGRLRVETKNFHLLNNLVGHGQIRHLFPDEIGEAYG